MYDHHTILRYLDNPSKIGFWTIDEFLCAFLPFSILALADLFFIGALSSIATYICVRFAKQHAGKGLLKQAFYWYFPSSSRNFSWYIDSSKRNFLG